MPSSHVSFPITGWGRPSLGDQLELRLRYFGSTVIGPDWAHRHHSQPYWRLYLNLDAGVAIRYARRRVELAAGAVWLVPPWISWAGSCSRPVRHINAHFEVPQWSRELCCRAFPEPLRVPEDGAEELLRTVGELMAEGVDAGRYFRVLALVARALEAACDRLDADLRVRLLVDDRDLSALRAIIEHNLDGDCSNPALARALTTSEPTLVRRFRSALGTTPARYVGERRVARAAELLATGDEPIERIATRCGFPDRHYFTRAFSRHVGESPARYRRLHRRPAVEA